MAAFWSMPSTFSPPNQRASKTFFPLTAVSHTLKIHNQGDSKQPSRDSVKPQSLSFLLGTLNPKIHSLDSIYKGLSSNVTLQVTTKIPSLPLQTE